MCVYSLFLSLFSLRGRGSAVVRRPPASGGRLAKLPASEPRARAPRSRPGAGDAFESPADPGGSQPDTEGYTGGRTGRES